MTSFDVERFRAPQALDRPVPFFSWNERMEPDELRRQIDLMADAGWGGLFVHSRTGLITPYLGDEWFEAVDATIDQCRKRGMKVWLYDEDRWPSGISGGTVPLASVDYRLQALIARHVGEPPPCDCAPLGEPRAGLQLYVWTSPLGHDRFNGACYAGLMHREAMSTFVHDAYEPYWHHYRDQYGVTILGEFTDEPCAIIRARVPSAAVQFTPGVIARFQQMHGYDPSPVLHLLFLDGPEAARFRLHYFRVTNWLFEHNFSQQLGDWCDAHGIAFTGHYNCEDDLYLQFLYGLTIMPNYRHMGIPGIDHLGRHVGNVLTPKACQSVVNQYGKPRMLSELYGVDGGSLTFEDRAWIAAEQMCLGVTLLNPHLSLYTMTGCRKRDYPQNIFYQQPWWPFNRLVDEPLSRVCAAFSQGRYHAEALVLHPGESVFVHWQTRINVDPPSRPTDSDDYPATPEGHDRIQSLNADLYAVLHALLGAQRTFDLGDETILADVGDVGIEDGRPLFRVNQMYYPAVILPSMTTMAATTLALLERFAAAGGPILRCGKAPSLLDGASSERLTRFLDSLPDLDAQALPSRVAAMVPPAVTLDGLSAEEAARVYVHVRDLDDGERLVYVVNLHRERCFTARLTLAGPYRSAYHLDTRTGEQRALILDPGDRGLGLSLPFAPAQSWLLLLRRTEAPEPGVAVLPAPIAGEQALPAAAWQVERLDDNALTLDYAYWRLGEDDAWSTGLAPVLGLQEYLDSAHFDGPLTLRYPVRMRGLAPSRKVLLVVEYPERYSIRVNGAVVEYAGLPAWRDFRWTPIDVTGQLVECENSVELHCASFQHGDPAVYADAAARYGTEIESIYLVGDFSVDGRPTDEKPIAPHWREYELPPIDVQCFAPHAFVLGEPRPLSFGDTTVQGLPFYAGRLVMATDLPPLGGEGRWLLTIDRLDAPVAEVAVDGRIAGHFIAHPLQVDLTQAMRGGGRLTITVYGTLRNLLGPHHHPDGELANVGPGEFAGNEVRDAHGHNVWGPRVAAGEPVEEWTDRYCMVSFGALGLVRLLRCAAS